jgi:hypothetical protein
MLNYTNSTECFVKDEKKRDPFMGSLFFISGRRLILLTKVGVWSRNRVWSVFTFTSCAYINSIGITTCLTMAEDEPVGTDALLINQEVDDSIHPIPA